MTGRHLPDWPKLSVSPLYRDNPKLGPQRFPGDSRGRTLFLIFAQPADDHVTVTTVLVDIPTDKRIEKNQIDIDVERRPVGGHGGYRVYFLCPTCRCICMDIFFEVGGAGDPVCRRCGGITYVSQTRTAFERKWDRISKLRRRLGSKRNFHPLPPRPRGMHRRTYEKLVEEIMDLEFELVGMMDRPRIMRHQIPRTIAQMQEDLDPEDPTYEGRRETLAIWERHAAEDAEDQEQR